VSSQAVAWAIVMQAGGPSAKAVLMSIANYANEYGECWASQKTIADGAEISVRQVRTILAGLISRGLIERERRGGEGRGRETDLLRLRMRELPAIITAKRRDQTDDFSKRQILPVTKQPEDISLASGEDFRGATGNLMGGNRKLTSDNPNNPSSNSKKHPIPADWRPSPDLIDFAAERGFSEHESKFMGQQMVTHFQATSEKRVGWDPTYKTWVNRTNPRQVKALAAQWKPLDYAEALRIWDVSDQKFWDRAKYGPAPNEPGYRGPSLQPIDLFQAKGENP
jgi:hypothetical protein